MKLQNIIDALLVGGCLALVFYVGYSKGKYDVLNSGDIWIRLQNTNSLYQVAEIRNSVRTNLTNVNVEVTIKR